MEDLAVHIIFDSTQFEEWHITRVVESLRTALAAFAKEHELRIEFQARMSKPEWESMTADVTARVEIPSGRNAMVFRAGLGSSIGKSLGGTYTVKLVAIPVFVTYPD